MKKNIPKEIILIVVVGEVGTGKTSIIKRYIDDFFSNDYKSTIGVDFALKKINWDEKLIGHCGLHYFFFLKCISKGNERFGQMTHIYYNELAVGAFIVFDITDRASFQAVKRWKENIDKNIFLPNSNKNIPCVLLGNKCDLRNALNMNFDEFKKYCQKYKYIGFFETSAKENTNIDGAVRFLVKNVLRNYVEPEKEKNIVKLQMVESEDEVGKNSNEKVNKNCCE